MSNAWACLYVSTTLWHSCTPPPLPSLPDSLLVWPTEGNSYSLVIMGRMMCALECALPAWLPLRRPAGAKNGKATERGQGWGEDRAMMGEQCVAGTMDHGGNYKREIWPDKQYCALQMSIGRGISAAVILSGADVGREGGGERRERQMERCRHCDMRSVAQVASYTLCTQSLVEQQI